MQSETYMEWASRKNGIIIWKIVWTYLIMIFHLLGVFGIYNGLYIGVEFFFIVSGYLLAKMVYEKKFSNAWDYTFYRIKKIFPHYIFSFAIGFLAFNISNKVNIFEMFKLFIEYIPEMLGIQMIGLNAQSMVNVPTWYISVLLICGFFFFTLLNEYYSFTIKILIPCIIMVVYSYFWREVGCLQWHTIGDVVIGIYGNIPLFRGAADMCVGIVIFWFHKRYMFTGKMIKNVFVEYAAMLCAIFLAIYKGNTRLDFLILCLLIISVQFAFIDTHNFINSKIVCFLEKLTYPLYLNHNMFRFLFPKFFNNCTISVVLFYLLVVTGYSIFTLYFVDIIKNKLTKIFCKKCGEKY